MDPFKVIGISIRTTNQHHQSSKDLPQLWKNFFPSNVLEKIPNKVSSDIYSIYTDYEKDYMAPYTVILGCKVRHIHDIPEGMVAKEIPAGKYVKYLAKGNLDKGAVPETWKRIWNDNLDRAYTTDFEVHGAKAQNREDGEVEIFVAVK